MSQAFLLWKGKGSNPQVAPSAQFVVVQQAEDVVLHSLLSHNSELARFHGAQNGGWIGETVLAFRKNGNGMVWQADATCLGEPEQTGIQAPGAQVVYAPTGDVASWEKNGKLWWNGQLMTENSGKIIGFGAEGLVTEVVVEDGAKLYRLWEAPSTQPKPVRDMDELEHVLPVRPAKQLLKLWADGLLETADSFVRVKSDLDSWLVAGTKNNKSWVYAVVEEAQ